MRRIAAGFLMLLTAAACSSGPSEDERRACEAAEGLLAANDREAVRERLARMRSGADAAENGELAEAARDFEQGLDRASQGDAEAAIGRFYDECARLGLPTPGD